MNRSDAAPYSKERHLPVWFFLVFLLPLGCKCAQSVAPIAAPVVEDLREQDLAKLPQGAGSLQDQLVAEAAARTPGVPSLERLTAAEGVNLGPQRQVMGKKLLAIYCAAADSADGLTVTVCEYPDEAQALRGETEGNLVGSKVAGHQSRVRGKSVLHLVARSDTPQENVARVLTAFDAL